MIKIAAAFRIRASIVSDLEDEVEAAQAELERLNAKADEASDTPNKMHMQNLINSEVQRLNGLQEKLDDARKNMGDPNEDRSSKPAGR